jgi:hypothetical protein
MHTSLNLCAETSSTRRPSLRVIAGTGSDMYWQSPAPSVRCASEARRRQRGLVRDTKRYETPDEADADVRRRVETPVIIGFGIGLHRGRPAQPHHQGGGAPSSSSAVYDMKMYAISERIESVMKDAKNMFANLDSIGGELPHDGRPHRHVHTAVRHLANVGMVGARHRAVRRRQDHPTRRQLRRSRRSFFSRSESGRNEYL